MPFLVEPGMAFRFNLMWARGDSNSQALRHTLLKRTCLPISPLARTFFCLPLKFKCRRGLPSAHKQIQLKQIREKIPLAK